MSKAEILAELPRLSAEDLAEVRAKLDELSRPPVHAVDVHGTRVRIATPRLADARQSVDFRKQVTELSSDAAL